MSIGDIPNNFENLRRGLLKIHFEQEIDQKRICTGMTSDLLPMLHHALLLYSRVVAQFISKKGYDLFGKNDLRFVENMYRLLRLEFNYHPVLSVNNLLTESGFVERKIMLINDVIGLVLTKHTKLSRVSDKKMSQRRSLSMSATTRKTVSSGNKEVAKNLTTLKNGLQSVKTRRKKRKVVKRQNSNHRKSKSLEKLNENPLRAVSGDADLAESDNEFELQTSKNENNYHIKNPDDIENSISLLKNVIYKNEKNTQSSDNVSSFPIENQENVDRNSSFVPLVIKADANFPSGGCSWPSLVQSYTSRNLRVQSTTSNSNEKFSSSNHRFTSNTDDHQPLVTSSLQLPSTSSIRVIPHVDLASSHSGVYGRFGTPKIIQNSSQEILSERKPFSVLHLNNQSTSHFVSNDFNPFQNVPGIQPNASQLFIPSNSRPSDHQNIDDHSQSISQGNNLNSIIRSQSSALDFRIHDLPLEDIPTFEHNRQFSSDKINNENNSSVNEIQTSSTFTRSRSSPEFDISKISIESESENEYQSCHAGDDNIYIDNRDNESAHFDNQQEITSSHDIDKNQSFFSEFEERFSKRFDDFEKEFTLRLETVEAKIHIIQGKINFMEQNAENSASVSAECQQHRNFDLQNNTCAPAPSFESIREIKYQNKDISKNASGMISSPKMYKSIKRYPKSSNFPDENDNIHKKTLPRTTESEIISSANNISQPTKLNQSIADSGIHLSRLKLDPTLDDTFSSVSTRDFIATLQLRFEQTEALLNQTSKFASPLNKNAKT